MELGARSALSLPVMADGRTVGALDLYGRQQDAFHPEHLAFGQLLAAHAFVGGAGGHGLQLEP